MIIANPIYDVVFKYLLEDLEIARGLLSRIIAEMNVEDEFEKLFGKMDRRLEEKDKALEALRNDFEELKKMLMNKK